jgi:DNA-binding IclR family transcriptional regulator
MTQKTVGKVSKLLNLFSVEKPEWGVRELGRELGIPKFTAHELAKSLAEQRLLQRTNSGRYQLGWRLFELSQTLLDTTHIRVEARYVLEDLAQHWGETSHLATLDGVQVVYLEKLPRVADTKRFPSPKGPRRPAHCSAVGKMLLANREWEQLAPLLEGGGLRALTLNTVTNIGELAEELEAVAERGYAYDHEESSIGLCCVAAPIYGRHAKVVAAASLCVPRYRFQQKEERYAAATVEAARLITTGACHRMRTFDPNLERG